MGPPGLTGLELDTIRLTAQFTAKHGKAFLSGLFHREQGTPLFAFIRPKNSLFPFFTRLVDIYQRIIMPPEKTLHKLAKYVDDYNNILSRCLEKIEFDKLSDHNRQKAQKEAAQEKKA